MNSIYIVEHLRTDPAISQLCPQESIGFLNVPGRSPLPHIIVAGGEGGDAEYTLGSSHGGNVSHYNDSFVVFACCPGTEEKSDLEQCDEILKAVSESIQTLEIPGFKMMYVRYQRPAKTELEQRTGAEDILRMGQVYQYAVSPL